MAKRPKEDEVLARVEASKPRRGFALFVMGSLGLLLIYLGFATPPEDFGYQVMLIVMGAGSLFLMTRMWQITQLAIELTMTELRLSDGTVLAPTANIVAIDRGMFAFKPSHGFTLKLDQKMPRRWHPGMWWRIGRRLGVGGVTPGAQTRIMADVLSAMVFERQPQDDPSQHS